jgi:perosamine synthetase
MDPVIQFAADHGLFVLEDAAEALGAQYKGRRAGSLGRCGTFSFFGNKIITTGEGGAVTTDDDELAARLRILRGQGMDPARRYWFPVVGYNYRMTNIQAAIGLAQIEGFEAALADRLRLAEWYNKALSPLENNILLPTTAPWALHAFWMYTVFLRTGGEAERDAVMRELDADGIETRPVFYPMHQLPPYQQTSTFPVADSWAQRGINLPTHRNLTQADVERVAHSLGCALRRQ